MDVIGDETYYNLEIIRGVRNAFAHAKLPIDFESASITDACDFMKIPALLAPHTVQQNDGSQLKGRQKFKRVTEGVTHNLLMFYYHRKLNVPSGWLKYDPPGAVVVTMQHAPLP
jgi:hypothetical protein